MIGKRFSGRAARFVVSAASILTALSYNASAWTFGCLQDWHNGDGAIKGAQSSINAGQAAVLQIMKDQKCEFVLFSGDMVEGFWLTDAVKAKYSPYSSLEDLVLRVGKDAYGDFLRKPAAYGLKAIGCVGDHEVGDNYAPPGTEHAQLTCRWRAPILFLYSSVS